CPVLLAFVYCAAHAPELHSFPTRRSSDLGLRTPPSRRAAPPASTTAAYVSGATATMLRAGRVTTSSLASGTVSGVPGINDIADRDRKSTRLNSSHVKISYAVFCLKKKKES